MVVSEPSAPSLILLAVQTQSASKTLVTLNSLSTDVSVSIKTLVKLAYNPFDEAKAKSSKEELYEHTPLNPR
jgi:hypothetical protein